MAVQLTHALRADSHHLCPLHACIYMHDRSIASLDPDVKTTPQLKNEKKYVYICMHVKDTQQAVLHDTRMYMHIYIPYINKALKFDPLNSFN